MIPYGRQWIDEDDVRAVLEALRSDYLTTGPRVAQFEEAFAKATGANHSVAVSSGTAALHAAMFALGVGPGDEVIVPALTFAASANAAVYQGATPVFVDVEPDTLLIDPRAVETGPRTKAIVAVDYAGQPCDYTALRDRAHGVPIIADACHALGASGVGTLGDLNCFSFHPVKAITTAEGGMITTADAERARAMRTFRNHGITSDHRQRETGGAHFYEMVTLGYNYRLSDLQCALGMAQLAKLPAWANRRRALAACYDAAFADVPAVAPLRRRPGADSGNHLYVIRLELEKIRCDRDQIFRELRAEGVGVNVHYVPAHLHPFYRQRFGTRPGLCPNAEAAYQRILTLPLFPRMSDADVDTVVAAVRKVVGAHLK